MVDCREFQQNLEWCRKVSPAKELVVTMGTVGDELYMVFESDAVTAHTRQFADITSPLSPVSMSLKDARALLSIRGETLEITLNSGSLTCEAESSYQVTVTEGGSVSWPDSVGETVRLPLGVIQESKSALMRNLGLKSQAGGELYSLLLMEQTPEALLFSASNRFNLVRLTIEGGGAPWEAAVPEAPFFTALPEFKKGMSTLAEIQVGEGVVLVRNNPQRVALISSASTHLHGEYSRALRELLPQGAQVSLATAQLKSALDAARKSSAERAELMLTAEGATAASGGLSMPIRGYNTQHDGIVHYFNPDTLRRALEASKDEFVTMTLPNAEGHKTSHFTQSLQNAKIEVLTAAQTPR